MSKYFFTILLFAAQISFAQEKTLFVKFNLTYQEAPLVLNKNYANNNENLKIDNVQFYISNIVFYKNGRLLETNIDKHFLINFEYDSTTIIDYKILGDQNFDQMKFSIGIDSSTNMSGVYGGALDPTQGMYWTWQSGYINVKIEGIASNCPARKNKFQYHLGGYSFPNNTLQSVSFDVENTEMITINVALDNFLNQIDLSKNYEVMSPSAEAVSLAAQFSKIFTFDAH